MKIKEKLLASIIFIFFIYIFSINNIYANAVTSNNMQIQNSYMNISVAKKGGGHSSSTSLKKKSTSSTNENSSQSTSSTSAQTKGGNIITAILALIVSIPLIIGGILFAHKNAQKKKKLI